MACQRCVQWLAGCVSAMAGWWCVRDGWLVVRQRWLAGGASEMTGWWCVRDGWLVVSEVADWWHVRGVSEMAGWLCVRDGWLLVLRQRWRSSVSVCEHGLCSRMNCGTCRVLCRCFMLVCGQQCRQTDTPQTSHL